MNVRHATGVLDSFSIKNIFYGKMDLTLYYFRVTSYTYLNFLWSRIFGDSLAHPLITIYPYLHKF